MKIPRIWFQFAALCWMAIIFYLSSQSHLPHPVSFSGFDKIAHFLAYAALAGLLGYGFFRLDLNWHIVLVVIATTLYGVSDEFYVPGYIEPFGGLN